MAKINQHDIELIAENAFEMMLEDTEICVNQFYNDMTSKQQKEYIEKLKTALNKIFDNELNEINKNWSSDSSEVKQLKNKIKELEREIAISRGNWSEDMGA